MAKPALGRGLGALLGGNAPVVRPPASPAHLLATALAAPVVDHRERVQKVPLTRIRPCPFQPRKDFSAESLRELADSIKEQGIVQPLIVRDKGDHLELIAGERRWRASQLLNLPEVPVIVREADDRAVLELALIENLQRENLNPIEEANGYAQLIETFQLKQEEVAQKVGKSRAAVANSMRLLDLHEQVQTWLTQERISVGHAKVLLSLKAQDEQALLAEEIIRRNLTVRAAEKLVADQFAHNGLPKPTRGSNSTGGPALAPVYQQVQNRLQTHLATHVVLHHGEKRGRIEIEYYGKDDLQRVLVLLGLGEESGQ